jgi:hypothetical protein
MSAERHTPPELRWLREEQGLPGDFLVAFTQRLLDRCGQLTRQGQTPAAAREQAVAEAVQSFAAGARQRGWTVGEGRIAQLADDTLGLEEEYRDQHGYEPELARLSAVGEVLDGERARQELPARFLRPLGLGPPGRPDPVQRQPSERTQPDGPTDIVRTREGGRER